MKVNDFEHALEGLETVIGWMVEDHHNLAISAIPRDPRDCRRRLDHLGTFAGDLTEICRAAAVLMERWEQLVIATQEGSQ